MQCSKEKESKAVLDKLDETHTQSDQKGVTEGSESEVQPRRERTFPLLTTFLKQRTIQATLGIGLLGLAAFAAWSWPLLKQIPHHSPVLAYVLVLVPTGLVMLIVLLCFTVCWYVVDYGWPIHVPNFFHSSEKLSSFDASKRKRSNTRQRQRVKQETAQEVVRVRPHHSRRTTVAQLQARRRQHLYGGRTFIGQSRNTHLEGLGEALSHVQPDQTSPPPPTMGIEGEADEGEAIMAGVRMIASSPPSRFTAPVVPTQREEQPLMNNLHQPSMRTPVSIYMLKELLIEVQNGDGVKKTVMLQRKRRGDDRYTERDLLAFLAALRGQRIGRLKVLESVFGYGLPDRERQPKDLRNQLNKATQFLRQDINEVAATLGIPELKIIGFGHDEWYMLPTECRVIDLEEIDRDFAIIEGVSAQKALEEPIQEACERLMKAYKGSFLENYIEDAVQAGGDEWDVNWMRPYYTEYLKKYLLAVWYRAEYWHIKADTTAATDSANTVLQRTFYETAAKLYADYVYRAIPGFGDQSAMAFALDIETLAAQAERALRSCLDMYTATGNTQAGEPVYQTFCNRMSELWSFLSDNEERGWQPKRATVEAWKNLKEQTKAHRMAGSVTPHEMAQDEVKLLRS